MGETKTEMGFTDERKFEYDAIVLYSSYGNDKSFVDLMCAELEKSGNNIRLLVPQRDLPEYARNLTTLGEYIEKRCRRCLVMLSETSVVDPIVMTAVSFANAISAGYVVSKIIPILIEKCEVPRTLVTLTVCDFTKRDMVPWFWRKLERSVKKPSVMKYSPDEKNAHAHRKRRKGDKSYLMDLDLVSSFLKNINDKKYSSLPNIELDPRLE